MCQPIESLLALLIVSLPLSPSFPLPPPLSPLPSPPNPPTPNNPPEQDQTNIPSPSLPLLNLTFATFLSAEFGFFGFMVVTLRHTAFIWGRLTSAGEMRWRARCGVRGERRTWLRVVWAGEVVLKVWLRGGRRRGRMDPRGLQNGWEGFGVVVVEEEKARRRREKRSEEEGTGAGGIVEGLVGDGLEWS
ncbi:MAG: hypothetical protein Q9184_003820 [Pyrenodesmia sp. 2 TL-2023]